MALGGIPFPFLLFSPLPLRYSLSPNVYGLLSGWGAEMVLDLETVFLRIKLVRIFSVFCFSPFLSPDLYLFPPTLPNYLHPKNC